MGGRAGGAKVLDEIRVSGERHKDGGTVTGLDRAAGLEAKFSHGAANPDKLLSR